MVLAIKLKKITNSMLNQTIIDHSLTDLIPILIGIVFIRSFKNEMN